MFGEKETLTIAQAKLISPVALAFVGDAVYSLYIRERMVKTYKGKVSDFQRTAGKVVSARGQSDFLETIIPLFTEEEKEIFLRGRNAKKGSKSKNAGAVDYARSTGFEAVLGFLYVTGQTDRLDELFANAPEEFFTPTQATTAYKP